MTDTTDHDLQRFVDAQRPVHDAVVVELRRGRKATHWMWFVFPQLAGLGRSDMARRYAIASVEEARAFLAHPVLGARLHQCAALLLAVPERSAEEILGPIDAVKLRSSATLFHRADPADPLFAAILDRFFDGVPDPQTDALLGH